VGLLDGFMLGSTEKLPVTSGVGPSTVGPAVGLLDGNEVGKVEGPVDGDVVGFPLAVVVGSELFCNDGMEDGNSLEATVGK